MLEDFIIASNAAESPEEVFQIFCKVLSELGFDRVVYSLLTDHSSLNKKAGHGVMSKYPSDWMEYYAENGYIAEDPVVKNAFLTNQIYTWDELIATKPLTKKERAVMDQSREAKLLDGAAIALYGPNFEIAGVGLASSNGGVNPDKNMLSMIRVLANQFHCAYTAFDRTHDLQQPFLSLTPREREVLTWAAEGKSIPTIASILSLSDDGVVFHLRKIYKKLDVCDKVQAVTKALRLGLITPSFVRAFDPA